MSDQATAMGQTIADLRQEFAHALASVDGAWTFGELIGSAASKAADKKQIAAAGARIDELDGVDRSRVESGEWAFQKWADKASLIHDSLAYYTGEVGAWSMRGVLASAGAATVSQVKTDLAIGALIATPVLLAVGAVFLLIYLGPLLAARKAA